MDDYFAGSRTPPPVPPASPPPYPAAGGWPPPPQPQPVAYPAPYPPPYQQPVGWGQPAPSAAGAGTSAGTKVLIAVAGAFGGLVVLGILAAIAIPVFLNQRMKAEAASTVVSAPAQVLGMPRLTDARTATQVARLQDLPGPGIHVAAAYGDGHLSVAIAAAKYGMKPGERTAYLDGATRSARLQGVTLEVVAPGTLGGEMRCGRHPRAAMTLCAFTDAGSYGVVVVTGPAPDPTATAREAREAFVHRT